MGKPKYLVECNTLRIKYRKDGTHAECVSGGVVVETVQLSNYVPKVGDELSIQIRFLRDATEPPRSYTIEDLMQMIAEKRE